jgi:type IV fimbrial biogenesis protein FimT
MPRNGFTLIELIVTISVAAILLALAVPSFQSLMISNRITAQTNDLVSDLAFARSEAIKRGATVTVCYANTATSCGAGTDWTQGWMVFVDAGTAGDATGDTILRLHEALRGNNTLTSSVNHYISYYPSGTVDAPETFTLCHAAVQGRTVAVSASGRVNTTPQNCP